jgi:type IV pilus assembly protein PilB
MDLLFQVLLKGFHLGAADINLESMEDRLDVRYQINGRYEIHSPLPLAYRDTLLESLFIFGERSFLKARPFTTCAGRLYIPDQDRYIRLRIEIQRGVHGYCAVCRPLDPHRLAPFLGRLPFGDARNALVKEILNRSGGLILIVGPTGSGKTTTLYGALTSVNVAEKNVRTIEDPVEYEIDGIIQNQIQEDSSFADGLRSMLRCNPDMILVGELRDHETASIAVRAALTGHLTLSTLHTFSAPDTVLRLLDMGISPDLLRMSLRMVISQRLLPILCPHCRQPRVPTDMEIERFRRFGVSVPPVVYDPNGCHICENRGYAGRRPLFEFLIVTPAVRDAIQTPFRISDFRKVWLSTGERPLVVPALEAAANGECSFDDAWRLAEDL